MNNHVSLKSLIALALLASSSLMASEVRNATPPDVSKSPLYFPNIDKNHDGFLSRSELPKEMVDLLVNFDHYDGNGDHRLSVSEYRNYLMTLADPSCNKKKTSPYSHNCNDWSGSRMPQSHDSSNAYTPPGRVQK